MSEKYINTEKFYGTIQIMKLDEHISILFLNKKTQTFNGFVIKEGKNNSRHYAREMPNFRVKVCKVCHHENEYWFDNSYVFCELCY